MLLHKQHFFSLVVLSLFRISLEFYPYLTHYYTVKEVGKTMNASNICCCRSMTREALLGLAYEAQNFKFLF